MSIKDFFELIALAINLVIGAVAAVTVIGLIVIIAFPELIQPQGYYRGKLRVALSSLFRFVMKQLRFLGEVLAILIDRQKLNETLHEINTGQKPLPLR